MEILVPIFISMYFIKLLVLFFTVLDDDKYEGVLPKKITTKKQVLRYIIPFGFLYVFYNYYKKLN